MLFVGSLARSELSLAIALALLRAIITCVFHDVNWELLLHYVNSI
jgi:hypothetical protein